MVKRFSRSWLINQIKINSVAFVSLLTALGGFGYNTWQGHQNDINQNMRLASFEVLKNLGELQTVVNYAHYSDDKSRGNPIDGWKYANMVRDLTNLLDLDAKKQGQVLFTAWEQDWEKLETDDQVEAQISEQIAKTRQAVLNNIDSLN
ncbi:MAG: hypothetical protein ACKVOA_02005 [Methylophilaceae bacterium]